MLAERILTGDIRAASRLMRDIDDGLPSARAELRALFPRTGRARIIGITGSPGAGKSTLTDRLIAAYRKQGKTVGVVAVDPTSPFSGGAILGDRIRMQDHATDEGVFIRSLATRGTLGGLSRATSDVVRVLDAMGKDVVLVETVGVGQDEIDIARLAHTTIVVVVPGMGDDVQAIKAGILEVADVFAVNKADREGADRTVRELKAMLELRYTDVRPRAGGAHSAIAADPHEGLGWEPPIVKTVASRDEGVDALVGAIEQHWAELEKTGAIAARETARARTEFLAMLKERLLEGALAALSKIGTLEDIAANIARREQDPYLLVEELHRKVTGLALAPQVQAPLREPDEQRVASLEARLGLPLTARTAALDALTHKSFVNEHKDLARNDNERLEFLGDAVIDLAVSHRLMERHPGAQEGELSKLRAAVVSEEGLAAVARTLKLGDLLLLGRGEELTGGREKPSVLADAFEAVVGAAYLSGGLSAVLQLVDRHLGALIDAAQGTIGRDYKTQLQEMVQSRWKTSPRYRVVSEQGPDHSKTFCVEIEVAGEAKGRGEGRTKKDAEQAAAREALQALAAPHGTGGAAGGS